MIDFSWFLEAVVPAAEKLFSHPLLWTPTKVCKFIVETANRFHKEKDKNDTFLSKLDAHALRNKIYGEHDNWKAVIDQHDPLASASSSGINNLALNYIKKVYHN